jgi:Tfp pilus assembly protein PilN
MRAVNLLPRDDGQRTRKQNLPALVSTGLIVLITGLTGVLYLSAKTTAGSKQIDLDDAKAELALLPSPADVAAATAGRRAFANEKQARVDALSNALRHRVAWDRVLREISLVLPDDVWLTQLSATSPTPPGVTPAATSGGAAPTGLSIGGYTYSHEAVARLITRLSLVPSLHNIWLEQSSRSNANGRPLVVFGITAQVRPPGATS